MNVGRISKELLMGLEQKCFHSVKLFRGGNKQINSQIGPSNDYIWFIDIFKNNKIQTRANRLKSFTMSVFKTMLSDSGTLSINTRLQSNRNPVPCFT